jgi:signal transduction histidine kinase
MKNKVAQKHEEINARLEKQLASMTEELKIKNRELEIDAALEKVRVRATAMRVSSELAETSAVLFHELNDLGIKTIRTGVGIFDEANDAVELWLTSFSDSLEVIRVLDYINMHIHPVFENIIPARRQHKPFALTILSGEDVRQYYQTMSTYLSLPKQKEYHSKEFFYSFFFPEGMINVVTGQPLTDEECRIITRFALVFGLIYTRFLDLQKAEAQAKEVIKQGAMDRVRGQIASMRSTADLQSITPLIWNELNNLGVLFIRCGIFIIDESAKKTQGYLSEPDGHSLGILNLPFDSHPLITEMVAHWRNKAVYKEYWSKDDFNKWTQLMLEQHQISDKETYQGSPIPPESLYLHFIPFSQGMLYIGDTFPHNEEEMDLAKSLAEAFSIAFARYEDFIQLEKAKQNIEAALAELKDTQSLLVHREKMASLGELVAGIAHEIQNPLNFVNNFSEMNTELLAEMKGEFDKGNIEEGKSIAENVIANEQKIIHHGKRVDGIVKSMLQHSRSSTGVKESTDINKLADAYLSLAYHGLRAKDKSFNAVIKTDFEEGIGSINIIPQDIGRVLLNLCNNAFYAVEEKKLRLGEKYQPTVTVSTKSVHASDEDKGSVLITVKDNGDGVPENVVEKIFQPFFTTKPSGKGTGLGLSLSYDIIKAHGGEIKVETKEGEESAFIIALPLV